MAFDSNTKRTHFINVMKSSRDFAGEHLAPLSESDVVMLLKNKELIDALNEKLRDTGFSLQVNWSDDQGQSWSQYPKSK